MSWTRSGYPRWEELQQRRPAVPVQPQTIIDDDTRPVVGRILGPSGSVLRVVRHGPEPIPFGFTA